MRSLAAICAALLALSMAAFTAARSTAPLPWPQLFQGLHGPPSAVPGLARPLLADLSRTGTPIPTPRQCVARWNTEAPAATRTWIVGRSARYADVTYQRSGAQLIGTSKKYFYSQCAFGIAVSPTSVVVALAPLPHSAVGWNGELLHYVAGKVQRLTARFNARVNPDGTLRLQ